MLWQRSRVFSDRWTKHQCQTTVGTLVSRWRSRLSRSGLFRYSFEESLTRRWTDFTRNTGRVVWKGHLCIRDQTEYNTALDHITARVHQMPCPSDDCKLCFYSFWNEISVELNLDGREILSSQTRIHTGMICRTTKEISVDASRRILPARRFLSGSNAFMRVNERKDQRCCRS